MMKSILLTLLICAMSSAALAQEYIDKAGFLDKVWDYETNTKELLIKSELPVVLDFYASWCGPCKKMEPELKKLQQEYEGRLAIYKIDVDAERELASLFGISAMPTIFFIKTDGSGTYIQGYRTFEELKQMVDTFLFSALRTMAAHFD